MEPIPIQMTSSPQLPHYLRPPSPTIFTLEITQRCRHVCTGCGNIFAHTAQEMDATEWSAIINQLRPYIQGLRITGGEPTLHKEFDRIIRMVDELDVPLVIFTNGNWANSKAVIQVLNTCKNLKGLLISLHGVDGASYQKFVGVDSFTSVTRNIRLAVDAGLRVATNTLLLTTTYGKIAEIADLAFSLGVSTASFGRYYGRPLPSLTLTADQLRTALSQIADLRREEPRILLSNCVPTCFVPGLEVGERGCTSGFTHCTIGPKGDVRPCTHTPLTLGYIQRDNIETIWQSPQMNEWRQRIPALCLTCTALNRCRGGCRALAQQLALPHDPLMTIPLTKSELRHTVELAADDRPKLNCAIESTSYGFALAGVGQFVTLTPRSGPILQELDGQFTVEQLQERFGPAAVQLIGSLLQKRLVELV